MLSCCYWWRGLMINGECVVAASSFLSGLSSFPQNNLSVFSQKIAFLRGSLLQKKSPPLFAMAASLYISVRISKIPLLMRVDGKCICGDSLGDSIGCSHVSSLVSNQILTMLTFLSKKNKKNLLTAHYMRIVH